MEPVENKNVKFGEQDSLSGLKDSIRIKSVLGIIAAIVGAILVYYLLSAITVDHGSASDPKVLSQGRVAGLLQFLSQH